MTRRLLLAYLTVTTFALVMVVVPLGLTFASRERDRLIFDLERDANAIGSHAEDALEDDRRPDLADLFADYDVAGARIVVTDRSGRSVADSEPGVSLGRDFSTRPEVAEAMRGHRATGRRHSTTLDADLVYVAVPVSSQGVVHGVVRITLPSSAVDDRVLDTWLRLGALSLVVLATVGGVGLILARGVTRPVRQVEEAARRLAAGDLQARAGEVRGAPELADLARQFDTTAERLEQVVEAQRRFVADASHQLRTPLAALRLRLETLDPDPQDAPRVAAALAETDRLARLVQSLLDIARSEAGHIVLADVDLAAVAAGRAEVWGPVTERSGVALVVEAAGPVTVRAVDGGVEQILDNLVSNALHVSSAGGQITVRLTPEADGGAALEVIDQGPGMSEEERAQATGRFWRPPGADRGGSGLGLAIVDGLALAAGGDLHLEEGPGGRGLRAVVRFAPPAGDVGEP